MEKPPFENYTDKRKDKQVIKIAKKEKCVKIYINDSKEDTK